METKVHERSAIKRELEVFIDEKEVSEAIEDAYKTIRPRLTLPGFRPGKAPLGLIKKMHGDALEGDALEKLAQEKFQDAAKDLDLKPIGTPVMIDLHRHAGEGAHFKVAYEVAPNVEIKDYSDLEAEKPVWTISDEDVSERLNRILFSQATREPANSIESEQSVVTIDMIETAPEEGAEPKQSSDIEVYLADPEVVQSLKEQLIGKKIGDEFTLDLPKHKQDKSEPEQGSVLITIKKIEKVNLPALDSELIEKISRGKVSTEEDLRKEMRAELERAAGQRSDEALEENIVSGLLERHEFEVPRTITHAIIDQMLEETKERNTRSGLPANYGIDETEYRNRVRPVAEARGKWVILRDKLIEQEKIEVTDEDLEALAEKEAEQYGLSKENLLGYYKKTDSIKGRLESEKLSQALKSKVKVVEKKIEKA